MPLKLTHIVYATIGIAFLWPWNALLSASLLAKQKLVDYPSLSSNYSSAVMISSTAVALATNLVLLSKSPNYQRRVKRGLALIIVSFAVLGTFGGVLSGPVWLVLLLLATAASSCGCALVQNGSLAITQTCSGPGHALAIMIGQAVAGVVPPLIPMLVGDAGGRKMALMNYLTVCLLAFLAYALFSSPTNSEFMAKMAHREVRPVSAASELRSLIFQLGGPISAVFFGFVCSLSYPVFANQVESGRIPRAYFAPLTHLVWNAGDLVGRLAALAPKLRIGSDWWISVLSLLRFAVIGLLIWVVHSPMGGDGSYLLLMLVFGVSGGFLIANAIARVPQCVPAQLQPAAGELIGVSIAISLAIGSAVSFGVAAAL